MTTPTAPVAPIGTQLSRKAAERPDAPAITCDGVTITRGELDRTTNRLARAYKDLGVKTGDYVTIVLPNSIEALQAMIAIWKIGAVVQPLSARLPDTEFRELLDLSPRALMVGREDPRGLIPSVPPGFVPAADVSDAPVEEAVSPVWKAMPSGGSTGRSKLIEVAADGRVDAAASVAMFGFREDDAHLVTGPLTHNTPIVMALYALLLGQHLILMRRFDTRECLRLIAEHRVAFTATVPTVMRRLLAAYRADPDAFDISSLRVLWHMAEPCPPELKQAWIDLLGPEAVWELYGGTELQALTVLNGTQWLAHRGSVGPVVIGEMKILDDDGKECPPGTVGEIFMRPGEGKPATYRYIGSTPTVRDGWETLGDMGSFDEDGFLYLSDRRVDMFNVGGRKVYPAEIEVALIDHPAVLSCLVVGVPDADLGAVPYALVETDPAAGVELDQDAVCAYLADRIERYKVPRHVEFRAERLRDDMGKARRSAVRAEVIARMAAERDTQTT